MRSDLSDPVQYVKGIGPRRAELLGRLNIHTVRDLVYHGPRRYLDHSHLMPIREVSPGDTVTVLGTVVAKGVQTTRTGRRDFCLRVQDDSGIISSRWFNQYRLADRFKINDQVALSGKVGFYQGKQLENPEYEVLSDEEQEQIHTGRIVPLYPLTAGLTSRVVRSAVKHVLDSCVDRIPETVPPEILRRASLLRLPDALQNLHFPSTVEAAEEGRQRLAFDELFYLELILALRKRAQAVPKEGISFQKTGDLTSRLLDRLNFTLTSAQRRVLEEVERDMMSRTAMNRLLQGDVGSGKTVVALLAMLTAVESGYQAALMAPIEILAEQHYLVIRDLLEDLGVEVGLLVGGMRATERKKAYAAAAEGTTQIMIGTHALIEENLEFKRLGLVVVDEQHRFGVMQRAGLRRKGFVPDCLVMTATPIPRTLSLTLYGDLDISILNEMPLGRRRIITKWVSEDEKRPLVYRFLREQILKGRQVYVVCPLVEESEKSDLQAATETYEQLRTQVFPEFTLGLLHGRMKGDEKDQAMHKFRARQIQIMVATTVVEVGLDVPNATVMLVERAERFGLAQLHQMRGRVGRGAHQSYCILFSSQRLSTEARERLSTMVETQDGFKIAEVDLKLRGPGEFLGTRQHGLPELKIADLLQDGKILALARREAFGIIDEDPLLLSSEHAVLRRNLWGRSSEKLDLIRIG